MERERRKNDGDGSLAWQHWCKRGKRTNIAATPIWQIIRKTVDSKLLGGKEPERKEKTDFETGLKGARLDPRVGATPGETAKE